MVITESSPRDGLQSLGAIIPVTDKVALINDLAAAGTVSFDAVSFVNPAAVPQMADAADVVAQAKQPGTHLIGLVPNVRGLEAALEAEVDGIGVLTAASDSFNRHNINATLDQSMARIRSRLSSVPSEIGVRAYVSTATHCPYEGPTDPARVASLAAQLSEWGVEEVFLGETLGRATPPDIENVVIEVLKHVGPERLGVHLHDTFGQAIANLVVCLETGISRIDASAGGLGGCPYAPGAGGNVATEDVGWLLNGMGVERGLDLTRVAEVATAFCKKHHLAYRSKTGIALLSARDTEQ